MKTEYAVFVQYQAYNKYIESYLLFISYPYPRAIILNHSLPTCDPFCSSSNGTKNSHKLCEKRFCNINVRFHLDLLKGNDIYFYFPIDIIIKKQKKYKDERFEIKKKKKILPKYKKYKVNKNNC
jgi:hypothetical protein